MALSQEQLNALARHGAQARITELREEIAAIEQAFSGLRAKRSGRPRKQALKANSPTPQTASAAAEPTNGAAKQRRSRGWSPSQRKAAAARMKAYWRKRKAGRKK